MTEQKDLLTKDKPNWCPGCGDYGILTALKNVMVDLDLAPANTVVATGIGCGSKINHWVKCYGFEGLHGRPLPVASAVKLCNPDLNVVAVGGDGDGYGLGMGHFIHAMRRNLNMTYIVQDNQIYGLTTGQTSPTSDRGTVTKSTPSGAIELPVNPIELGFASGATYIARGYAGDLPHLTKLIADGISHKGFALIDVFQPCVTFNKINTYQFFQERVYKLEDDPTFKVAGPCGDKECDVCDAIARSREWGDKIPIGLFYKEDRATYESEEIGLKDGRPVDVPAEVGIEELMSEFM
ncbi:2-oxoacid:ferredoxin oxidoreductase subunit beta [Candidatus Peregrinibacteria bacterium]|jgi:2-oxoglutarate/2-oxoacid ferredoxin oxidoreductase subunit beta|nr:2-oxoacid:ferredoxin oxidoreductase subunit beta [Candidatus Peregrinibacteria bacterium]